MEPKPFKSVVMRDGKLVISLEILTRLEKQHNKKPRFHTRSFKTAKHAAKFYGDFRTADWYRRYPEAKTKADFFERRRRLARRTEHIFARYLNGNS